MTTLIIEDSTPQTKQNIAYVRSFPFMTAKKKKSESEFNLYENLNSAFSDVRLMLDGKKKEKTAEEFLEEMRNGK